MKPEFPYEDKLPTPYKIEQARIRSVIHRSARLRDQGATDGERRAAWDAVSRLVRRLYRLRPTRGGWRLDSSDRTFRASGEE